MQEYRNIVNIINFLRGYENDGTDLVESIRQNIRLLKEYRLKSTFLIQYDVFYSEEMMTLVKNAGSLFEKGAWLEIVGPLVVDAGLPWRGNAPWDFHANVAFLMGYTVEERKRIIDTYMARFRKEFGYYPKAVGAWMIDSVSLDYLLKQYHVSAACICKEQYGTDGYNLWGGYYNHAYYPSRYNMLCPAQTKENQIGLPVFRMLGTDPIHQYDSGLVGEDGKIKPAKMQSVITIEPVYPQYGGNPRWVDWFLSQNTKGGQLCYSYVQIGQENSFDWKRSGEGLSYQYPKIKEMADRGEVEVEYLSESGQWFAGQYDVSPACAQFFEDCSEKKAESVWYYSRYYRFNLYGDSFGLRIRDLQKYDENYRERYYNGVETEIYSTYDNLPVMDGYRFSKEDFLAGGYFSDREGKPIRNAKIQNGEEKDPGSKSVQMEYGKNKMRVTCEEKTLRICATDDFRILLKGFAENQQYRLSDPKTLRITYQNYDFSIGLISGKFVFENGELSILSADGRMELDFTPD